MTFDIKTIEQCYTKIKERTDQARKIKGQALSLAEKILYSHLDELPLSAPVRGETYVNLCPDRVAMQDATAQMALLQFMQAGKVETAVPATVHCDHLIPGEKGAESDLCEAKKTNKEVYDFLESVSKKYGIGFWGPNTGIIHQIIFENYAFPGGLMIGTDSHTPNAGGMGMAGIGVGGADAVDVMVGMPWELKWPKVIGVKLTGKLSGWASAKDIILKILGILTVKGGTGSIVEYFGEGVETLSATGRSTITNMGAELGATTSIFPFDQQTAEYLKATNRKDVALMADQHADYLKADNEVYENPEDYFDNIIEINLSELEPHLVGPFTPDLDRGISAMKEEVAEKNYPQKLEVGLIGSCTNSSYEDLSRVTSILEDGKNKGLKPKSRLYISPGSEQIRATLEKDGILKSLTEAGAVILTNSCGPCIGQWRRTDWKDIAPNTIVTSFNRNFKSRNDGNPETLAFIASPELIAAQVLAGKIDFDPENDTILNDKGEEITLKPPVGDTLPKTGFANVADIFNAPKSYDESVPVIIKEDSQRLEKLTPFEKWDGKNEALDLYLLGKFKGKCTTDHISPAGKWLRFRGHLDNISNNMFSGALNYFSEETGKGKNPLTSETEDFSAVARALKNKGYGWIAIGDENYGEGSSREHAAMEPRHLGCKAIIARSFARIAENNLKKQGVLVTTFKNPDDYELIKENHRFNIKGFKEFAPGSVFTLELIDESGEKQQEIILEHSFSEYQIDWFKAGSSLNYIRSQQG